MAFSVPRRGLSNRFGEKLWKLTHLHKDRLRTNYTFNEWCEILRSTARREGVSIATLESANDSAEAISVRSARFFRKIRVDQKLHKRGWDLTGAHQPISSCYPQKRSAEAALHPLHRECTSEVEVVGRPHKGTLVRAGYAVGTRVGW